MLRITFSGLWARKRRLISTAVSVILGVAFLCATLALGQTMEASFTTLIDEANAGTDVLVRNATTIGSQDQVLRGTLDRSVAEDVAALPGVAAAVPQVTGIAQLEDADGDPMGGQGPPTLAESWNPDPHINPFQVAEGRAPEHDGEVAIDALSARDGNLAVGDTTTARTPDPIEVTIVGIVHFGDDLALNGATYVAFTPTQAEDLFGQPGQFNELLVRGDGSLSQEELQAAIEPVLPKEAEALTRTELIAEQRAAVDRDFLGFLRTFLLLFAGIALVVATFSIYNTFNILMAQRAKETALLRAIGASRRQVLVSVAAEALVIGTMASLLGIAVGYGLGLGLKAVLGGIGLDLSGQPLVVSPGTLAVSVAVGLVVTMVASIAPAVRASRVAPMEALRDSAAEPPAISRRRTIAGAGLALMGVALTTWSPSADPAMAYAGLGSLILVIAAVVLGPTLARPAARLVGAPIAALRGQPGRLARRNAMRNPRRTASSALALVIGVAVVALFATFGASLRASIDQTVAQTFGGDLVIAQDSFSGSAISTELTPALEQLDEVNEVVPLTNAVATYDGTDQFPTVAEPAALTRQADLDVTTGSLEAMQPGQVAVGTSFATEHRLTLGDRVPFTFVDGESTSLEVAAIYNVEALMGDIIMTPADWEPHAQRAGNVAVLIDLADGVSMAEGRSAVEAVADQYAAPKVQDRDEYIEAVAGEVDQLLILVYGLLGLAVLIALLGIANTLSLSIHERSRELGLLRAIGLTRGGLRSTVRWESVITAVTGTAIGAAVGTFLGWGVVRALATEEDFIIFRLPAATLVTVGVFAVLAGVVAAVRPAHRAGRMDVLDAIAGS